MTRSLLFAYAMLAFAIGAWAQSAPQAFDVPAPRNLFTVQSKPAVFHPRIFWPVVGAYAASAVADIQTSRDLEREYSRTSEVNSWLLGRRPSAGRYYATFAVMDGASVFISYKLLHSRRKLFRVAGWTLLGEQTAGHTSAAIYNSRQ